MAFVTDTFTDTDAVALTAHAGETGATWTSHPSYTVQVFDIRSNRARAQAGASSMSYASGAPAASEYDVSADIIRTATTGASDYAGVSGRMSTSAETHYMARHKETTWQLYKISAGSFTSIGSWAATLVQDQVYRLTLEIRDAAKKVIVDGVTLGSSANNDITATGKAGLFARNTPYSIDNFDASDPAGGAFSPWWAARKSRTIGSGII